MAPSGSVMAIEHSMTSQTPVGNCEQTERSNPCTLRRFSDFYQTAERQRARTRRKELAGRRRVSIAPFIASGQPANAPTRLAHLYRRPLAEALAAEAILAHWKFRLHSSSQISFLTCRAEVEVSTLLPLSLAVFPPRTCMDRERMYMTKTA